MVETSDFKEPKFFDGPWTDPPPKNKEKGCQKKTLSSVHHPEILNKIGLRPNSLTCVRLYTTMCTSVNGMSKLVALRIARST